MAQKISQATSAYGIDVSDRFTRQVENPKHRAKYDLKHVNGIARFPGCPPRGFLPEKNPLIPTA
ncbi:MAG: XRE family transcriptional regulator [Alistipes sp.]|nr:XRE family transcriptional regulator [Alistipes sp.]